MNLGDALDSLFGGGAGNTTQDSLDLGIWFRPFHEYNDSLAPLTEQSGLSRSVLEVAAIVVAYSVVVLCSLVGNTLVVVVISLSRRLHTVTNIFILNMAVSDLLMTLLNIPFNVVRNILEDWPFGGFMCGLVQISVMTSVYVSSFTMMAIALDRYVVIVYPLRPRMTLPLGGGVIFISWLAAILMSLPYALYARIERVELLLRSVVRCRLCYPEPGDTYERALTLLTLLSQYVIPMSVTASAYGHIVRVLWSRDLIGTPSATQRLCHRRARRRTIRMLIVVVVIFCGCWLPLQMYHVLTDWHPDAERFQPQSSIYLTCHWLAMSSVCYNPLVYCGLNTSFRHQVRMRLSWLYRHCAHIHPGDGAAGSMTRADKMTPVRKGETSSSSSRPLPRAPGRLLAEKPAEPTQSRGVQVRPSPSTLDDSYPLTTSFLRAKPHCFTRQARNNVNLETLQAHSQWV